MAGREARGGRADRKVVEGRGGCYVAILFGILAEGKLMMVPLCFLEFACTHPLHLVPPCYPYRAVPSNK